MLLLLANSTISTPDEAQRIRNTVLVHGAWAAGSGWKSVYDILVKDGYNVGIVQGPETSFKDDVAATKRILALQGGPCIPCILAAHRYCGAVITGAGTDPSVAGLVYIAAHMPDSGEKESDGGKRFRAILPSQAQSKNCRTDSHLSTRASSTNYSQPIFPLNRPPSWRAPRC